MPRQKLSLWLTLLLTLMLLVWLFSGTLLTQQDAPPEAPLATNPVAQMRVQTRWLEAQTFAPVEVLQGQLQPWQQVVLRAETSGRVERWLVEEGESVQAGQVLLQLSQDQRPAQLRSLRAEQAARNAELDAAVRLRENNLLSETEWLNLNSRKLQADAALASAELDLVHTRPVAPFAAQLERHEVEIGAFVQAGDPLAVLVNSRQLKAVAAIPQQRVGSLQLGQAVSLQLLDGRQLAGQVSFIGHLADNATRTFRLEVTVDNPSLDRLAGASVTLQIQTSPVQAHFFSPALLSLDAQGRVGVKQVDDQNRVAFSPVELLSTTTEGVWVSGLPRQVQIITLGGGFVAAGDEVVPFVQDTP